MDKYYNQGGGDNEENQGLTTEEYNLSWLADLIAVFFLENTKDPFNEMICCEIYRNDRLTIFKGNWRRGNILMQLNKFHAKINFIAGSNFLNFTVDIWEQDKDDGKISERVTV